ncbi:phenylacetate--CoA ligase family protein [Tomitella gaofuii]|uniref:phenylacetate--CoA ligase family protein n=1 Tax=Tomitella gaofuii TaxID=2760083 RepID=UPI0015F7F2B4|nr:phenylacetate--CoA ligase family protein [Tomitella gaofuii]
MPPSHRLLNTQYRIRRAHPMTPFAERMLRRTASATPAELAEFQERHLKSLIRVAAARSRFYREWFAGAGVDPRTIQGLDDLGRLPLLDRSHLVTNVGRFRTRPASTMWSAHSSGTSGRVVTVYRTPWSAVVEHAILERQRRWFAVPARARSVILRGHVFGTDSVTRLVPGANQLLVSSFHLDDRHARRICDAVERFSPEVIEGWPSSIALLARQLRDRGRSMPVRVVVTSSEVTTAAQRALISESFAAPIADQYGQTERAAMAGVCEAGGYHVFPDYGIVELLPLPERPGRFEIVGTPLHNRGFPLFRYRTGDEVGPAPTTHCACGRAYPLIGTIDGRRDDAFTAADGRALPQPSIVLDDIQGLREAQIVQQGTGRFEIRLVPDTRYDADAVRTQARRNIDRYFGTGQQVNFVVMDRIPRTTAGKLRSAIVEPGPATVATGDGR